MDKELNCDSHIYLYAKHHYKRSKNKFTDLRKIYARRNGVNRGDITNSDILGMMTTLVYKHITNEQQFTRFISGCFSGYRKNKYFKTLQGATLNSLLDQLLSALALTKVKEESGKILIPLDEPDYTILSKHD